MDELLCRDATALIDRFRHNLRAGGPWFEALLDVIALWEIGEEVVDGRDYRYLLGGEAFDWLRLAERLCDAVAPEGLLPREEVEALLVAEQWPLAMDAESFAARLGPAKYRAHLNFVYGVRVEEALQLAVEEEVQKEQRSGINGRDQRTDEDAFQRIYGASRRSLLEDHQQERQRPITNRISLSELKDFTYWLFRWRIAKQDPARVASDTRRGLLRLNELERRPRARRGPAAPDIIESSALPTP